MRMVMCTRDSISHSVGLSVGPSVRPSVALPKFLPKSFLNRINAPAHPYATDAVVYMPYILYGLVFVKFVFWGV